MPNKQHISGLLAIAKNEVENDPNLTMNAFNDSNKRFDPDLRSLLAVSSSSSQWKSQWFYKSILESILNHLKQNTDPTISITGPLNMLNTVLEAESDCNKQLVAQIFSELQLRLLSQFESSFIELYAKENMIMGLQSHVHKTKGYNESTKLAMVTQGYQI